MDKLVSVIMPAYNSALFIEEAIQSIIDQTYPFWELLIMDDCSSDNTAAVVEAILKRDQRIKLFKSEKNTGIAKQMNKALVECRGEYICRMDSDDISHPDRIREQLRLLEESKDIAVCMTGYRLFTQKDQLNAPVKEKDISSEEIKVEMMKDLPVCGASFFARREVMTNYFFDEGLKIAEDYDLFSRMILVNKISNISKILYYYRKHGNSITDDPASWKAVRIDLIRKRYLENTGVIIDEEQSAFLLDFISARAKHRVDRAFFSRVRHLKSGLSESKYYNKNATSIFFRDRMREYLLVTKNYARFSGFYLLRDYPSFFVKYSFIDSLKIILRSVNG